MKTKNRVGGVDFPEMLDRLVEAAKHWQYCQDNLNNTDGYFHQNTRALEQAGNDLQKAREDILNALPT